MIRVLHSDVNTVSKHEYPRATKWQVTDRGDLIVQEEHQVVARWQAGEWAGVEIDD